MAIACVLAASGGCTGEPYGVSNSRGGASLSANRDGEKESAHKGENASASASAAAIAEIRRLGNHLKGQPSPYLEQHAHNPVDWYPWGDEALIKAKRENKPIFLSVGYSTCHWCHVMAHESFEDDEVAAFLNEHFVSIKVDREQRPDIDALYIDSVRAMGGSTGWPLTVFLTPKLEPFFGGTYYPRHSKHGRPGFLEVLDKVRVMYADEGDKIAARGQQVLKQIERQALSAVQLAGVPNRAVLSAAMRTLARRRDPNTGGFGNRQKFPNTPLLIAELRHIKRSEDPATKGHLVLTLDEMLRGGIRDHLDGSFHRYAVDTRWHIPHFEKMLYDNGQLAGLYIEAGLFLEREDYVLAGRQVLDDLIAKWRGAGNAFIVGFDADDPVGEGAYYSWTPAELDSALGTADGQSMAAIFGVSARGDRELEGRSVLHRQPGVVPKDGGSVADLFARAMPKLRVVRESRPKPGRDDKVLVSWNGLAIMALADAGRWLQEPRYVEAAQEAGDFILGRCWKNSKLKRGYRGRTPIGEGFLDDYALAGLAFVRLHAATGDAKWLEAAHDLTRAIIDGFYDPSAAAFMRTHKDSTGLPVRMADMDDNVLPSGGTAATLLVLEVAQLAGDTELFDIGFNVLGRCAGSAARRASGSGFLLQAIDHAAGPVREVVVAGAATDAETQALWAVVAPYTHARVLPVRIPAEGAGELGAHFPALEGKIALRGKPTAYVCEQGRCQAPTADPNELKAQLDTAFARTP